MPDLETIGTNAGSGAFGAAVAYAIAYFKSKELRIANTEIQKSLSDKVSKEVCDVKREYLARVSDDLGANFKRLEAKIDILIEHSLLHRKEDK